MVHTAHNSTRREALKSLSQYMVSFALGIFLIPLSRFLNRLPKNKTVVRFSRKGIREGINVLPAIFVFQQNKQIKILSRRCPHLGCTVQPDAAGKELRCPCHGSRFTVNGKYIAGPAKADLQELAYTSANEREWKVTL